MSEKQQKLEPKNQSYIGVGISIGVGVGTAIGVIIDNLAMGIGIGVAIGTALGIGLRPSENDTNDDMDIQQKPE